MKEGERTKPRAEKKKKHPENRKRGKWYMRENYKKSHFALSTWLQARIHRNSSDQLKVKEKEEKKKPLSLFTPPMCHSKRVRIFSRI